MKSKKTPHPLEWEMKMMNNSIRSMESSLAILKREFSKMNKLNSKRKIFILNKKSQQIRNEIDFMSYRIQIQTQDVRYIISPKQFPI